MMASTPEKRSTSISYPIGSKMYKTIGIGEGSVEMDGPPTSDMFYRESTEKKYRL